MDPQREPEQRRVPVHQRSHRCLSYSNVAATLALVIAIGGGSAWAAQHVHYLVTSSNQIKPSVLKKLHGAKGTTGAKGTIGARGVAGTAAVNGAAGVSGGNGANGAAGVAGPTGLGGPTGGSGAIGATGVTGPNGAVAGYSAAAADITFTGGTDTLIVSKDLPAGDFILSRRRDNHCRIGKRLNPVRRAMHTQRHRKHGKRYLPISGTHKLPGARLLPQRVLFALRRRGAHDGA